MNIVEYTTFVMLVLYQLEPACVSTDAVIIIAGGGRAGRGAQLAHNKHIGPGGV